ncbi:semaphorin-3E isoform X1 [Kryptolebias marmoratus]|uniref:Sema domain, immunoglobulin domain (Ig), short basic domain, secreted, (semaphorin) 3E n=1 Tax=Kryptolebias marmoratus TaxID=37003 RepID=A0A3Q3B2T6_KRYMA|nr:semaphorin-3E isoform X1 [Kryptolebias marmoratus]
MFVSVMMAGCKRTVNKSLMLLYLNLLGMALTADSIYPRIRLSHKELWQMNRTWVFQGRGVPLQPQTMLLDEIHQRLYVGAKNALFSLSLDRVNTHYRQINWASTESQIEECMMKGREKPECANYIKVLQQYNQTHLLVCGTGAFNPVCVLVRVGHKGQETVFVLEEESFMSGKGRCPYDPKSSCISTPSRGELYIGLYTDYWENDGALCRLNNHTYTRTERNDRQQLNEPKFVASAVIPDNDDRDDDKVYFFFTEREMDADGVNRAVYARVGRVCANDQGGQRMLVNRWSSFLKTRFICSVPGPNGIDTHFDDLEDVFVLNNKDKKNPEIFGLFSTTSAVFNGYAVCVYHMDDIRAAFNGPFASRERPEHHWTPYEDRVPYPRPGSCASKVNGGGFSSSKEFPDEVLRFVRSHPVMYRPVLPQHHRPVLLQTEPGKRKLTQIAVDRVQAQDGHYHVLYIGTDDSVVLKVITIYNKDTDTMEEVLLEELQVFKVPTPITEIIISPKRQQLYVGSAVGVTQVRLHQCDLYGSECADCCLARDPYCAWDGLTCSRYYPAGVYTKSRRFRRQDVRHGNAAQLCNGLQIDDEQWQRAEERLIYSVESNSTLLECVPRSLQAKVLWFLQKEGQKQEIRGDERVIMTSHGLLFLHVRSSDAGVYVCQTVEHGYVHTLLRISLHVLKGERLESVIRTPNDGGGDRDAAPCHSIIAPPPGPSISPRSLLPPSVPAPNSRLWYKEFLQLIGYGDAQKVEEYCERVWCSDKKRKKTKRKYVPLGGVKKGKGRGEENSHRAPRHTFDT